MRATRRENLWANEKIKHWKNEQMGDFLGTVATLVKGLLPKETIALRKLNKSRLVEIVTDEETLSVTAYDLYKRNYAERHAALVLAKEVVEFLLRNLKN